MYYYVFFNLQSIEFHEKGKNHQENVKRRLAEVSIGSKMYSMC